ncbi:hypothetical protein ACJX0J_033633, partial [Zea mays]
SSNTEQQPNYRGWHLLQRMANVLDAVLRISKDKDGELEKAIDESIVPDCLVSESLLEKYPQGSLQSAWHTILLIIILIKVFTCFLFVAQKECEDESTKIAFGNLVQKNGTFAGCDHANEEESYLALEEARKVRLPKGDSIDPFVLYIMFSFAFPYSIIP